jgi:hypothetical protein
MSVACAMIVRDAEDTIERCIRSVRPHVAQVCVYLGGESSDGTVKVLERLQKKSGPPLIVKQGEWRDDFAWARTQSFAMVAPEHKWVIWLDSDDVLIDGDKLSTVEALAELYGPVPYAMMMYEYKWLMGGGRVWNEPTPRARVVHRHRGEWQGQVHEDFREHIAYRDKPSLAVPYEIAHVKHQHELRPAGRYLALVEQAALDPERTPRGLFLLARELCALDRHTEALPPLLRYLSEGHDAIEGDPNIFRQAALDLGVEIAERIGDGATEGWLRNEAAAYSHRRAEHEATPTSGSSTPGRNEPCSCGSGKKYKKCHGA